MWLKDYLKTYALYVNECTYSHAHIDTQLHEAMDLLVSLIAISIFSPNCIYFHLILILLVFSGFSVHHLDSLSSDLCSAVGWQMCRPFFHEGQSSDVECALRFMMETCKLVFPPRLSSRPRVVVQLPRVEFGGDMLS